MYIQYLTPEDATITKEELTPEARWSYYVSSYAMSDPTESVQFDRVRMPFLKRTMPANKEDERGERFKPLIAQENLVLRINTETYGLHFEPNTTDWWYYDEQTKPAGETQAGSDADGENITIDPRAAAAERAAALREKRRDKFLEKHVNNPAWMHEMSKDEVDQLNQRFRNWVGQVPSPKRQGVEPTMSALASPAATTAAAAAADADARDVDMTLAEPKRGDAEGAGEEKKDGDDTEMADA